MKTPEKSDLKVGHYFITKLAKRINDFMPYYPSFEFNDINYQVFYMTYDRIYFKKSGKGAKKEFYFER